MRDWDRWAHGVLSECLWRVLRVCAEAGSWALTLPFERMSAIEPARLGFSATCMETSAADPRYVADPRHAVRGHVIPSIVMPCP